MLNVLLAEIFSNDTIIKLTSKLYFVVCAQGMYGEGCLQRCRCERGVDCDHVTGACQRECPAGWRGADCSEGMVLFNEKNEDRRQNYCRFLKLGQLCKKELLYFGKFEVDQLNSNPS